MTKKHDNFQRYRIFFPCKSLRPSHTRFQKSYFFWNQVGKSLNTTQSTFLEEIKKKRGRTWTPGKLIKIVCRGRKFHFFLPFFVSVMFFSFLFSFTFGLSLIFCLFLVLFIFLCSLVSFILKDKYQFHFTEDPIKFKNISPLI